jgi:hypothetical protein
MPLQIETQPFQYNSTVSVLSTLNTSCIQAVGNETVMSDGVSCNNVGYGPQTLALNYTNGTYVNGDGLYVANCIFGKTLNVSNICGSPNIYGTTSFCNSINLKGNNISNIENIQANSFYGGDFFGNGTNLTLNQPLTQSGNYNNSSNAGQNIEPTFSSNPVTASAYYGSLNYNTTINGTNNKICSTSLPSANCGHSDMCYNTINSGVNNCIATTSSGYYRDCDSTTQTTCSNIHHSTINSGYNNAILSRNCYHYGCLASSCYNIINAGVYNTIDVISCCYGDGSSDLFSKNQSFTFVGNGSANKVYSSGASNTILNGINNILDSCQTQYYVNAYCYNFNSILNGSKNKITGYTINNTINSGCNNRIDNCYNNYNTNPLSYNIINNGCNNYICSSTTNPFCLNSIINGQNSNILNSNASTILNGNINTINISNFSTIVNGVSNCINLNNNSYAYIAGGCNNSVLGNSNIFVLGSNIKTSLGNFTYVNNLSATGNISSNTNYTATLSLTANQTAASASDTILNLVRRNDPNIWFNLSSKRFLPTVAGYYNVNYQLSWQQGLSGGGNQNNIQIRKNLSTTSLVQQPINGSAANTTQTTNSIIYLNGSSDYVDFTAYSSNAAQVIFGSTDGNWTKVEIFKIN